MKIIYEEMVNNHYLDHLSILNFEKSKFIDFRTLVQVSYNLGHKMSCDCLEAFEILLGESDFMRYKSYGKVEFT